MAIDRVVGAMVGSKLQVRYSVGKYQDDHPGHSTFQNNIGCDQVIMAAVAINVIYIWR